MLEVTTIGSHSDSQARLVKFASTLLMGSAVRSFSSSFQMVYKTTFNLSTVLGFS